MSDLNLGNIQGNIVPGFKKDHQAFVMVRFDTAQHACSWLRELQNEVASAAEVTTFNELFKDLRTRRKAASGHGEQGSSVEQNQAEIDRDFGTLRTISSTWVNVAFTWRGLQTVCGTRLEVPTRGLFENRVFDAELAQTGEEPDAILLLAADWSDDLSRELSIQTSRLQRHQLTVIDTLEGNSQLSILRGHEYFGYKDAISQPRIRGTTTGSGASIQPGEFILGHPSERDIQKQATPDWMKDGSFLVFLRLEQDVAGFDSAIAQNYETAGFTNREQLGAAFVGRWRSGVHAGTTAEDIKRTGSDPDPNFTSDPGTLEEQADPYPFSHIGRANPRDPGTQSDRHRLIRRGIPYAFHDETGNVREQGLLFLAYQADIHEQFEHVWQQWLNSPDFPVAGAGVDPLIGQLSRGDNARAIRLLDDTKEHASDVRTLKLPQFVTPKFCSYLFAPSISALARLAGGTGGPSSMADDKEQTMKRFADLVIKEPAYVQQFFKANEHITQAVQRVIEQVGLRLSGPPRWGVAPNGTAPDYTTEGAKLGNFILRGIPYSYDPGVSPKLILDDYPITCRSPAGKALPKYNEDLTPGDTEAAENLLKTLIDGPASDYSQGHALPKTDKGAQITLPSGETVMAPSEDAIRKNPNQSLWWYFDGTPYRLVKAVRVAYTVQDSSEGIPETFPRDPSNNELIRHFLIGYMGVDPSGG